MYGRRDVGATVVMETYDSSFSKYCHEVNWYSGCYSPTAVKRNVGALMLQRQFPH
jgi:hypothetical protein